MHFSDNLMALSMVYLALDVEEFSHKVTLDSVHFQNHQIQRYVVFPWAPMIFFQIESNSSDV